MRRKRMTNWGKRERKHQENENYDGSRIEMRRLQRKITVFIYDWWCWGTTTTAKRFVVTFDKPILIKDFMEAMNNGFKEKIEKTNQT